MFWAGDRPNHLAAWPGKCAGFVTCQALVYDASHHKYTVTLAPPGQYLKGGMSSRVRRVMALVAGTLRGRRSQNCLHTSTARSGCFLP